MAIPPIRSHGSSGHLEDHNNIKQVLDSASTIYLSISDAQNTYVPITSSVNFDIAGAAATAEENAKNYADSLSVNYDSIGSASAAEFNANSYTNTEIANLISYAPDSLNTLNELAAAINNDPNFYLSISASLNQYLTLASASATYYTKTESEEIFVLKTFGTTSLNNNSLIDGGEP